MVNKFPKKCIFCYTNNQTRLEGGNYVMKQFKRFYCFLLIFVCTFQITVPNTDIHAASAPSVSAHAYVIMDANTGKTLYSKNPNKRIYPASTVKLMSALVVLDRCNPNKTIKITKRMLKQVPADSSVAGLKAGNSYSVSALLHMLLLPSAGDAAVALAYGSYGSNKAFVAAMNQKAKKLSLSHTSFDNPIGLDIGNHYYKTYTTASDFSKLARYAMTNSTIRKIVSKSSYTVPKAKYTPAFTIKNTNQFLTGFSYNKNLYQVIGGKTGTTKAAGSVLITSAVDKKGHEVICAFFGNQDHKKMYSDIRKLLNFTFKQGKSENIPWKKGFWDVRYRNSEAIIRTYYNKGDIPVSTRFYPTKQASQKVLLSLINQISNHQMQAKNPNNKLSVMDFATIYYEESHSQDTITASGSSITSSSNEISKKELENAKDTCMDFDDIDTLNEQQLIELAYLVKADILPASVKKHTTTYLTKEQAVLLANNLNHQS